VDPSRSLFHLNGRLPILPKIWKCKAAEGALLYWAPRGATQR